MPVSRFESRIAAPVERVFAFHESADALAALTPPWERVTIERAPTSLAVGTVVVLVTHVGPIPLRWVAEHVAYEKDRLFVDRQVSGPFARWEHRHVFAPIGDDACLLTDDIRWALPLGLLGGLGAPLVRRKLDRLFAFRHAVTRERCERLLLDREPLLDRSSTRGESKSSSTPCARLFGGFADCRYGHGDC